MSGKLKLQLSTDIFRQYKQMRFVQNKNVIFIL